MQEVTKFKIHEIDKFNLKEKVADYAKHAFAKNTLRAYQSDWKNFGLRCLASNIDPITSDHKTLIYYITYLAEKGHKSSNYPKKAKWYLQDL